MTLRVHASLTADGTQAKAEVAALTKQMDGLGNEMTAVNKIAADEAALFERLGAQAKGAGWGLSGFADPLAETVKTSKQAAAPIRDTADGIDKVAKSSTVAAGSMGNMAAQFNDIIVMMAAGQNPLQLALQQGTQITQAYGNRGASGALRMLWGGLTSLVSPINLITIGSIAAGAAMVQWLTSSAGEAVSLEERIEGLEERISSYREVVARDLDDLKERWGDITPEVMQLQREAANLNLEEMLSAARVAASDLREELSDGGQVFRTFRDNDRRSARTGRSPVTDELKQSLATIGGEGTLEEQIKAVQTFKAEVVAAAGGWDAMNDKQRAFVGQINAVLDPLQQSMAAIQSNMGTVEAGWESLKNIWEAGKTRAEEALEQLSAEQEIVATLQNRAELAQLTAQYGEDSKAVAEARAAQEAEALHTMIDQSVKSDELNQQAHELVDALYQAGSVDVSARLEQGRATAAAMADEIQRAVNGMLTLNAQGISSLRESELRLQYKSDPVGLAGALADERFGDTTGLDPILQAAMDEKRAETIANAEQAERNRQELVAWQKTQSESQRSSKRAGKSAASEAEQQAEAVDRLISRLRSEVDVLREMDPIQRSLIQNRDVLAHATRAEQAEVKRLLEEEQNLNALQAKSDWFKSTAYDAITSLTDGANGVEDAFERVARAIEDAAWQAMLLGEGPFGNAFGGKESGGLLGMISSSLLGGFKDGGLPAFQDGGMFYSQGHSRADKGHVLVSSGEFIVNGPATQRHRGLLEAINSGSPLPAFATGGYVGGGASSMSAFQPSFQIINNSSGAITGEVEETTSPTGGRAYRLVLADQVGDALVAPGGGASRTMKNTYGARKRTARR